MEVAIIGATGYGGAELVRLLHRHPEVNVKSVHTSSKAGVPLGEVYPHFGPDDQFVLEEIEIDKLAESVDLVFLATPSGVSSKLAFELYSAGLKLIDLSGDLRLKESAQYEAWYKKDPAPQQMLDLAVYGLTEWNKERIANADIVSNPGCYPTATLLGLGPLINGNIIDPRSIIIDAKSGLSGAGRSLSQTAHFAEMNNNFNIYKVNQHQHIPEIEQMLKEWDEAVAPITFSTHLVPITRGIMATMYVTAVKDMDERALIELYQSSYTSAPFVRIRHSGNFPGVKEVYGSNFCDIGLTYDPRTGRITVVSVIDNLMKGAAGQAVQNLNVMLGLDEQTGLDYLPMYP